MLVVMVWWPHPGDRFFFFFPFTGFTASRFSIQPVYPWIQQMPPGRHLERHIWRMHLFE